MSGALPRPAVAPIAHCRLRPGMVAGAGRHRDELARCDVVSTATTGGLVRQSCPELRLRTVKSRQLGGDQQTSSMIAKRREDALASFADPLKPVTYNVDVEALPRTALAHRIACASGARAADPLVAGGAFALRSPTPSEDAPGSPP